METLRSQSSHAYRDEHLFVDLRHELVMLDSQVLCLTRQEYCLLLLLVQRAGKVVPRRTLSMKIWGYIPETRTYTLDKYIHGLRKKLGGYADQYIGTVTGVGYRFRPMPGP